jgi:hypothetical protein
VTVSLSPAITVPPYHLEIKKGLHSPKPYRNRQL